MPTAPPENIDDYIATFPKDVQSLLKQVRKTVRSAAPKAVEVISYRMPALRLNGILIYFAAFKNHIGFYPPIRGDAKLAKATAKYSGEKGNLRFPFDEPLPLGLIKKLTALRVKQDLVKGTSKTSSKHTKSSRKKK